MTTKKTRNRRKVYAQERRKWLEDHETGVSMNNLALRTGRNPQTIKKQIEFARDEREYSLAQVNAYSRAITQHNDQLLKVLGNLRSSISYPHNEYLTVLGPFGLNLASTLGIGQLTHQGGKFSVDPVGTDEDDVRLLELAREHLKRDRGLWRGLDVWQDELREYAEKCYALGQQVGDELGGRIDVGFISSFTRQRATDEGVHEGFISWVCRLAINEASGDKSGVDEAKLRVAETELRYGGTNLATYSSQDHLEKLKALFVEYCSSLSNDIQVLRIVRLKRHLEEMKTTLRRDIGDFLLLGLVRGKCSLCKRLRP